MESKAPHLSSYCRATTPSAGTREKKTIPTASHHYNLLCSWYKSAIPTPASHFRAASPCGSAGKESACNVGDLGSIPGLGRCPGEGKGYSPQYSGLESSMDSIVHGFAKSRTWLSDFHFTCDMKASREIKTRRNRPTYCYARFDEECVIKEE